MNIPKDLTYKELFSAVAVDCNKRLLVEPEKDKATFMASYTLLVEALEAAVAPIEGTLDGYVEVMANDDLDLLKTTINRLVGMVEALEAAAAHLRNGIESTKALTGGLMGVAAVHIPELGSPEAVRIIEESVTEWLSHMAAPDHITFDTEENL